MGFMAKFFGIETRADEAHRPYSSRIEPPLRSEGHGGRISTDEALSIPAVFRALDIIVSSSLQLPIVIERWGETHSPAALKSILAKPSVGMSQREFVSQLIMCLLVSGNAYVRKVYAAGELVDLQVLPPHEVMVLQDPETGMVEGYAWRNKRFKPHEVRHITKLRLPGRAYGLGPIQAAQKGLRLAADQMDFASAWFDTTGQPAGLLKVKDGASKSPEEMRITRNMFNGFDANGNRIPNDLNPMRVKLINSGWDYEHLLISPKDALWLEAQNFSTLEIARLFGVPASLMYAVPEGSSMTYANVDQEWLGFVKFTLMGYLIPIEDALTEIIPTGQRAKFNLEGLLRSDTRSRYDAHQVGITAGFLTVNEAREIEGRNPLEETEQQEKENVHN